MIKIIFSIFKIFFLVFLFSPLILLFILIYFVLLFSNNGNPLFWSKRIGLNNQTFLMPKFRSMKINTPYVASHLLQNSNNYITKMEYVRFFTNNKIKQKKNIAFLKQTKKTKR